MAQFLSYVMLGIPALLSTYMAIHWWAYFGVHQVYPYLGTLVALLLWVCLAINVTENEED
jgi:hypothetical protein